MDLWLSVPTLYFLLFVTHLASADSPTGVNRGPDQQEILRLLLMASQSNRGTPTQFTSNTWGIPFRPVRRIGSEFLGKRSEIPAYYDDDDESVEKRARMGSEFLGKRGMGSEFLGKRGMGSEFLGKRGMGSEFLGKRGMGSEFLGKRRMGSEFLGKRRMGSEFLGKRGMGSEFLGKRGRGSEFLGKRRMGSEFLGKRGMGSEFLGKRRMGSEFLGKRRIGSEFLGKREYESEVDPDLQELPPLYSMYPQEAHLLEEDKPHHLEDNQMYNLMEKRALGSEFLGKRKQGTVYDYSWKRGRLGSEFLGKRSAVPEQPSHSIPTVSDVEIPLTNLANTTDDKITDE